MAPQPTRSCAGCGCRRAQNELVRLSLAVTGDLLIGATTGRGTYLCPDAACVERALRTRAISRRLKADPRLPADLAERILQTAGGGSKSA